MERPPVYVHETNICIAFHKMPSGDLYAYRCDSNGNALVPGVSKFDLMIHYYNEARGLYMEDQDGHKIDHDFRRLTYEGASKRVRQQVSELYFEALNDPVVSAFFKFLEESESFEASGHGARRLRLMQLIEQGLPLDLLDRMDSIEMCAPPTENGNDNAAAASVDELDQEAGPKPAEPEVEVDQCQDQGRYENGGYREQGAGDMAPAPTVEK